MNRLGRIGSAVLVALSVGACTPVRSALRAPYEIAGAQYSEPEIQALATDRCRRSNGASMSLPPNPFTTDGCSLSPNGSWTECCIEHDMAYWCDGAASSRRSADQSLRACVAKHGHPMLASLMYAAVRLGGNRWFPLPWRWGYGYPWPRGSVAIEDASPIAAPEARPGSTTRPSE